MRAAGGMLALLALLLGTVAVAQVNGRERRIGQFYHSRWTVKDGAPGQVSALAQTPDGFLWMASAAALYSFDGVHFRRFEPPDGQPFSSIQTLYVAPDGALWVGFIHGTLARLKEGQVTRYGEAQGLPLSQVTSFATDAQGALWASTSLRGVYRLNGSQWERIAEPWGLPAAEQRGRAMFVDRDGALWLALADKVYHLEKHGRAFRDTGITVKWVSLMSQAPDGTLWVAEPTGAVRPIGLPGGKPYPGAGRLEVQSAGVLFDREGSLWATSLGDGVRRIAHPEQWGERRITRLDEAGEPFTERDGLSSDYTWPIIEDREGNLWVGTSGGLDRFRHSTLVLAEFPRGSHDFAIAAGNDGALWAGTTNRPLMRLRDRTVDTFDIGAPILATHRDRDGQVWLAAENGLWRIQDDKPLRVADLPAPPPAYIHAMTKDAQGTLWAALVGGGLYQLRDGTWTSLEARTELRARERIMAAATDPQGRVWLGQTQELLRVEGTDVRRFGRADGLELGIVTSLSAGQRLWVGGQFGLAHFDGQRFHTLDVEDEEPLRGVSAIVELPDGGLWVHAIPGILHLRADELARVVAEPGRAARCERFDFLDGLPARPTLLRPLPTAVRGTDGRLWFATSNGVVWIDPTRIFRNPLPPPVAIHAVRVDGQWLTPGPGALSLREQATNIEIDYTALSLSIPERVRFRYRLEGVDTAWQDVGGRREAYYSHLSPGRYRFQVLATNNDGVWNETGAALEFVLPPAFFQTWWFRAVCGAAVAVALWLLYLLRLRQVRARLRRLLEERHLERERIARELHDTLLQGIHGLVLRFQAAAEMVPTGHPARVAMEKSLERADQVLVEGRDRVMDLRATTVDPGELSTAFTQLGEELGHERRSALHVVVEGTPVALDPVVRDEVFRIGREALANAFQHAGARRIEVVLTYDFAQLRLRVRDDGRGVEEAFLQAGGKPGHWGLSGMRERAVKLGARLDIRGRENAGTEVELRVPAATAYQDFPRGTWHRLRRLVGGLR
ncbi:ATPase [Myxococcus sp. CA033]|uniref:sensor histidine kinase n=1 Tax=Myxococcus sp. CA033 TaxID=2741516 RepID=UPI00157AF1AA|nr:sensor histidine kinase [Myxococcus sp. CA033]NTX37224.1 ATPase [Myxococcus sp. CA033]